MILGHLSHKGCVVLLSGDNAHLTEPTLIRRKQMTDEQRAALQVVWEQLNGVMNDLNQIRQAAEDTMQTVDDCIARLEQIGVGQ
jgi:hypothetical protein